MAKLIAFVWALGLSIAGMVMNRAHAADAKPLWQAEWDKTVKVAKDAGVLRWS